MLFTGTDEERGIKKWRKLDETGSSAQNEAMKSYELPLIQKFLDKLKICEYMPFCPRFSFKCNLSCCSSNSENVAKEEKISGHFENLSVNQDKSYMKEHSDSGDSTKL